MTSALSTLDRLDPEADPVCVMTLFQLGEKVGMIMYALAPQDMLVLLSVLGKEKHQNFAAKLRQLKLCEEALADV